MPATLQPLAPARAKSKQGPARPRMTLEELLRRAAASVERGPTKLISGTFRQATKGRPLTRFEKGLMLLMVGGLSLAIWLHARPAPVSAHATYFQTLASSTPLEASAPRTFAESALQAIGRDWRAETFFACAAPGFWRQGAATHPNARVARVERGLASLSGHGSVIGLMTFPDTTAVAMETLGGIDVLASQVAGQLELADGTVVRFAARLVQDGSTKRWGLVDLAIPGFLP